MTEADFYNTTARTFANIVEGYNSEFRLKMELHRESIVSILLPHMNATDRKLPISRLYPLTWDKENVKGLKSGIDPLAFWAELDEKEEKLKALESKPSPEVSK